jgi:aminoglycoside phosphotransferase (APT) family kinase protein
LRITKDVQSEISRHLISSYSELSGLHQSSFSQIHGGADTSIFAFDLRRDSVTVPLILRIHRPENSGSARREYQIMKGLHSAGFDIPKPYILLEKLSTLDRACIVMERIQGQLLSEEIRNSYPGSRCDRLIREYMKTMAMLHSIDWAQHLSFLDSDGVSTDPQLSIDCELSRPRRLLREYDISELTQIVCWLEDNEVKIPRVCLIHGDFHAMNIIVTNDSRLITIDWTNAKLGDFRTDLGFAVVAACSSGLNIRKQLVSEYESATHENV